MELLSAVMQDTRFMDAYNKWIEEGRRWNMDAWIDEAESRGREEGEDRLARLMTALLQGGKNKEAQEVLTSKGMRRELYLQYGIQ